MNITKIQYNMTQEDKQLLLKDLSARLPYGVKVQVTQVPIGLSKDETLTYNRMYSLDESDEYITIKPYLRPMSSMTEEERNEYLNACGNEMDNALSSPRYSGIDYLNANHFDYRGLIPKELAIEAPEGMYKKGE